MFQRSKAWSLFQSNLGETVWNLKTMVRFGLNPSPGYLIVMVDSESPPIRVSDMSEKESNFKFEKAIFVTDNWVIIHSAVKLLHIGLITK
ncbi:hypothetical protein BDBG_06404 [Blastomyces gilchristii SLH14081]|uniref:Uncharacterized protein n=1 Tax=Blastomyces gilchristii (strain SLH14081) TaxID=559298 RepID=A0A179US31_BLAGS|nr:uncharacterized protein BDBG_06404 [Blastomyces gilchristii SLH14081]OAT10583.1 hypothetical protein BDBG_06404 [Blastomyces gilchristii SLH14081]